MTATAVLALAVGALLAAGAAEADSGLQAEVVNLVANGSFEDGAYTPNGRPTDWLSDSFSKVAEFTWDDTEAFAGGRSVAISSPAADDARWFQTVTVEPDTFYLLSGWIKTSGVAHSGQPVDAGANLCLDGTWQRTAGVFGDSNWTYVSLVFDSGPSTQMTVGARLGYWSGTTTGAAWFDDIQVTRVDASDPHPSWRFLVLIYHRTDFTFTDAGGTARHVVAQMTPVEQDRAEASARRFVTEDVAALDSGHMAPTVVVRFAEEPLTRLSPHGNGWWPAPSDTAADAGGTFDSVIVIWDPRAVDQDSGESIWLGSAAGLTPPMGTGTTYNAVIIEAAAWYNHRNVFKHEWGHSILFYFDAAGTAPKPAVTNHAGAGTYVHCPTGEPYVWADETLDNPIPNSIYNNASGFTHDYYSGTVATADQPDRCLGIPPAAWATGGPVSKPARKLPPFPSRPPRRLSRSLSAGAPPSSGEAAHTPSPFPSRLDLAPVVAAEAVGTSDR